VDDELGRNLHFTHTVYMPRPRAYVIGVCGPPPDGADSWRLCSNSRDFLGNHCGVGIRSFAPPAEFERHPGSGFALLYKAPLLTSSHHLPPGVVVSSLAVAVVDNKVSAVEYTMSNKIVVSCSSVVVHLGNEETMS
jgi:hypothetical protein